MDDSEKEFREHLKSDLDSVSLSSPLTEGDKEILLEMFMNFVSSRAESVESLFNPDNEDGLEAVPLYWTKTDN